MSCIAAGISDLRFCIMCTTEMLSDLSMIICEARRGAQMSKAITITRSSSNAMLGENPLANNCVSLQRPRAHLLPNTQPNHLSSAPALSAKS